MQSSNAHHGDKKALKPFYLRLTGQAAKCGSTQVIEKEVKLDIFIAKMKFTEIPRELCIGPGNTVDEWLKAALLHEKGYATANVLQKQNTFGGVNSNYNSFKVKQKHTISIQLKNKVPGRMNRELGNTRNHNRSNINSSPNQMSVSQSFLKTCCLCGKKFSATINMGSQQKDSRWSIIQEPKSKNSNN